MTKANPSDPRLAALSADDARRWPAHNAEVWPIERLSPYQNNARRHSSADVRAVAQSIRSWGWTSPILIDDEGGIIAGHARHAAAKKLKLKQVPVVVARGWTKAQKQAYCLADNALTLRGTWDPDLLRIELTELNFEGFDVGLIGFDENELSKLMSTAAVAGLTDPDRVPEMVDQPVSRPGDLWQLGPHRALCGDCTESEAVKVLLGESQPVIMVTDPPYGVNYDPSWREGHDLGVGKRSKGKVLNDDRADWREAWVLFPGKVAYIWHSAMHAGTVAAGLSECGFQIRAQIVWSKQHFALSRGDYHWQHELCWYAVRRGASGCWTGDRKQSTVWAVANNNAFGNGQREQTWGHGTQKPVECMRRPILNNSRPGDIVYDPFLGSGTTLIAATMTGRICLGLELNPAYVDVIVRRFKAFTGTTATLAGTGQSFDTVAVARGVAPPSAATAS